MTGHELLAELEAHCGAKVTDRRLRFQITSNFDRLTKANEEIARNIKAVLNGAETFDPKSYKAIALSDREK